MFSRQRILLKSMAIASLLILVACSEYLEKKPEVGPDQGDENGTYVINVKEAETLKLVPAWISSYIKDELPKDQVAKPFEAIRSALGAFTKYTRGANPDVYTSQELQKFLNKYLLKQNQISDDFLVEMMQLKSVWVGGSLESISRTELAKIDELLQVTTDKALQAHGWMRILLFKAEKNQVTPAQLDRAEFLLNDLAMSFIAKTKIVSSNYEFSNLKEFTKQLAAFLGEPAALTLFEEWVPLVEAGKNLFLGEISRASSPAEYRESAGWIVRLYGLGLRSFYQLNEFKVFEVAHWPEFLGNVDRAIELLKNAPLVKDGHGLLCSDIDRLIDLIAQNKLFSITLDLDLLKSTYRKFVLFVLESRSNSRRTLSELVSVNASHINVLSEEYAVWKTSQKYLISQFQNNKTLRMQQLAQASSGFLISSELAKLDSAKKQIVSRSWQDFVNLLNARPVTVLDTALKVQVGPQAIHAEVNFKSTLVMNALRSMVRLVLKAYGDGKTGSQNLFGQNITKDGMIHFEQDFEEFGRAINFLDRRIEGPAKRAFKEGNFFAFHGNGDDLLSSLELYELLSFMVSAGLSGAHQVQDELLKIENCMLPHETDVFGEQIASYPCFIKNFKQNYPTYLSHLPKMVQFMNSLNEEGRDQFLAPLVYSAKLPVVRDQVFEFAEIRTAIGILQYVESVVNAYDKDRNGLFTEEELLEAYKGRFQSFFDPIAAKEGAFEWMYDDAFLYLVYNGAKPTSSELVSFIARRQLGLGLANRLNILKTLGVLKTELAKIAKVRVEATE